MAVKQLGHWPLPLGIWVNGQPMGRCIMAPLLLHHAPCSWRPHPVGIAHWWWWWVVVATGDPLRRERRHLPACKANHASSSIWKRERTGLRESLEERAKERSPTLGPRLSARVPFPPLMLRPGEVGAAAAVSKNVADEERAAGRTRWHGELDLAPLVGLRLGFGEPWGEALLGAAGRA